MCGNWHAVTAAIFRISSGMWSIFHLHSHHFEFFSLLRNSQETKGYNQSKDACFTRPLVRCLRHYVNIYVGKRRISLCNGVPASSSSSFRCHQHSQPRHRNQSECHCYCTTIHIPIDIRECNWQSTRFYKTCKLWTLRSPMQPMSSQKHRGCRSLWQNPSKILSHKYIPARYGLICFK